MGWRWAIELARHHEVVVLTDVTRRIFIEPELLRVPQPRLRIVYFRPNWLARVPLNSRTAQTLYTLWQFSLLSVARRLHRQTPFDLAMHITYGVFRHPSFLGSLGIPFVFGPLGGGEDVPMALKRSIRGTQMAREWGRSLINKLALVDPFLWFAFSRATHILVKTDETRQALPWPFRQRALVYQEIGIDAPAQVQVQRRAPQDPFVALYAGRFLGLKGIHLGIRAVAEARQRGAPVQMLIVGQGPYEAELRRLVSELQLDAFVQWRRHVPQQELFALYGQVQCLLFPSLHDSSGNVVLEAQAHGCPVVCLACGGPLTLLGPQSGVAVDIGDADEAGVVHRLADALVRLEADEEARIAMAVAAHRHAMGWGWQARVEGCLRRLGYASGLPQNSATVQEAFE